jgi:N-acetyl-anhydromuramyl-L-alanine amidase AmpD
VAWFQQKLARVGYLVPLDGRLDEATRNVLVSFQMRYRPARYDGVPDAEMRSDAGGADLAVAPGASAGAS